MAFFQVAHRFGHLAQWGKPVAGLDNEARVAIMRYDWPGNVRELRNLVERLVILPPGDQVTEADVRALLPIGGGARGGGGHYTPGRALREIIEDAERELVLRALEHHQGHITRTAADLGLERSHLYKKMRALGIRQKGGEGETEPGDEGAGS